MTKFRNRFILPVVLILLLAGVSFITGCVYNGDGFIENNTVDSQKLLHIEGTLPPELISTQSSGAPGYAVDFNDGKYSVAVVDKYTFKRELGTVTVTGSTFSATLNITNESMPAVIIVKDKATDKILYQNYIGKTPVLSDLPAGVSTFTLKGVSVDSETTARALLSKGFKSELIDFPIATVSELAEGASKDVTGKKSLFDTAVDNIFGADTVANLKAAVQTVNSVLTSTALSANLKNLPEANSTIALLQNFARVTGTNDSGVKSFISANNLATSVTLYETKISSNASLGIINNLYYNQLDPSKHPQSKPTFQKVSISPSIVSAGDTVTITLTASTALYSPPAVFICARSASVVKVSENDYSASIQINSNDRGNVTFSITSYYNINGIAGDTIGSTTDQTSSKIILLGPKFNPPGGTYTSPQSITLTTYLNGANIYYTTNGNTPSSTYGSKFDPRTPINISSTTIIKAIAIIDFGAASPLYYDIIDGKPIDYGSPVISEVSSATYTINIPTPVVAAPSFSPQGGIYASTQSVTLSSSTPGAVIRYTTDGSDPTATTGFEYSSAISVSSTMTIKAIATKTGMSPSALSSATYTINIPVPVVAAPSFSPQGGIYASTQSVTLSSSTPGAVIRYTTDGSDPTATKGFEYSSAISVSSTMTIKAIAKKTGMSPSAVSSATYTITAPPAAVSFDPPEGAYDLPTVVTLASTPGAVIAYTTDDGTTIPSIDISTLLAVTGSKYLFPLPIARTVTITAIAANEYGSSQISRATYKIRVLQPKFNPQGGSYNSTQSVTLTSATTGAVIRYTISGADPTEANGTVYSSPIKVSSNATIKAIATKTGMSPSAVSSAAYTINIPAPALAPAFNPATGSYTSTQSVSITSATTGAKIYYTLDGTPPAVSSALYSGEISVASNTTIKAIAVKDGLLNSSVASAVYDFKLAAPVFSPASGYALGSITITCATDGARIYYTRDGTVPTTASALYSAAIPPSTMTLKAIAVKDGFTNSDVTSANFVLYIPLSADATLKAASTTIKGQAVTSLGTPNATLASAVAGAATITAAKAADTSNATTFITLFDKTNSGATVTKVVKYASGGDTSNFSTDAAYNNEAITDNDFFIIKVTAENSSVLYYKIAVTVVSPITDVTSAAFTMLAANNTVTITLTGGEFKASPIAASDFTFAGTDAGALAAGQFTRTSDTVVTVKLEAGLTGVNNTVLVKAATQAIQATSVAAAASTVAITSVTSAAFTMQAANNTVTITLTGGKFKTAPIAASDFTFAGTDAGALAAGQFIRTSDTVVTIKLETGLTGVNNTVLVKAATQVIQAASVAAAASTVAITGVTSAAFTMQAANNTVTITLTGGKFKAAPIAASDFTFAGTDAGFLEFGQFTRTSDTVVTIKLETGLTGTNNTVLVKAATQVIQAASVAAAASTVAITNVTSAAFTMQAANNTVTITLTGGKFKAAPIAASDFTFAGTDAGALAAGQFTRTSDTVVTIKLEAGLTGVNNTVLAKAATQVIQAESVAAEASTVVIEAVTAMGPFTMLTANNTVTITLTGGKFKTASIDASDFTFAGDDALALTAGQFTRVSDTVVIITSIPSRVANEDITITVEAAAQVIQATSVEAAASTELTSVAFTTTAEHTSVTITLTGGQFKAGPIVAGDFTFTGTDAALIAGGTFTRTSDTIVTVTGISPMAGGTDNTVLVKEATQAIQATSVAAASLLP